jgi:hypothetical protein
MATSTGKTLALILILIIILTLSWRLTPLILAPLGAFTGAFHIIRLPDVDSIQIGPWFPRMAVTSLVSLALFILWVAVIIWVYRDAERRGMNGVLWALLVFIGNLIGLLIYLIVRAEPASAAVKVKPDRTCPKCRNPVSPGFAYCPHCGASLQATCPECGKPVEPEWKACPSCGRRLGEEG